MSHLLLLVLGLLYRQFKTKQRTNKQLASQQDKIMDSNRQVLQEKEWLLKEVHHRVKNNLQIVMSDEFVKHAGKLSGK